MPLWTNLTPERKAKLYESRRKYAADLKKLAYDVYDNRCACGSQHNLRLRLKDPEPPIQVSPHQAQRDIAPSYPA